MDPDSRHQCLLYEGAPSRQLPALAQITRQKLLENYRCLYLNSRPMVAGFCSYLAATGIDVEDELAKGRVLLVSEQSHLVAGVFEIDRMIHTLEQSVQNAVADGYAGLFATGDMTWEFWPDKDFAKLVEYELRLEETIRKFPQLSGICQYHSDTLPPEAMRLALGAHGTLFVNATLARINPHYTALGHWPNAMAAPDAELDAYMVQVLRETSI